MAVYLICRSTGLGSSNVVKAMGMKVLGVVRKLYHIIQMPHFELTSFSNIHVSITLIVSLFLEQHLRLYNEQAALVATGQALQPQRNLKIKSKYPTVSWNSSLIHSESHSPWWLLCSRGFQISEAIRMQMEVQHRLQEQLEVCLLLENCTLFLTDFCGESFANSTLGCFRCKGSCN